MNFEKLLDLRNRGFAKELGLVITKLETGFARGELILQERHKNPIGVIHGGVIFTLADTIGGTAANSRGRWSTTVSGNINYVSPALNCEKLIGETREVKVGKNICVYEVVISNELGKTIATSTMTYFYFEDGKFPSLT